MNEKTLPWDDLRVILAIARTGSLSGARRDLGVSHATVFRRLAEIERRLGVALFQRDRGGYTPTTAGEDVAAAAERIESEVDGVARRIAGRDLRPSGTVRVTTTDTLLHGLLSPVFARFREANPEITLEVAVSNQLFSLSKREADVALRPSGSPPESLVGRRLGSIAQAIYGRAGQIRPADDAGAAHDSGWIGPDELMGYQPLASWLTAHGLDGHCRYRVDSLMGAYAAVRDGAGLAVLPCYLADADERLVRIGRTIPDLETDLWMLTHPDLRKVARIRVLMDFVAEAVAGAQDRLSGETRPPDGKTSPAT